MKSLVATIAAVFLCAITCGATFLFTQPTYHNDQPVPVQLNVTYSSSPTNPQTELVGRRGGTVHPRPFRATFVYAVSAAAPGLSRYLIRRTSFPLSL
jgi:hypothetical protein